MTACCLDLAEKFNAIDVIVRHSNYGDARRKDGLIEIVKFHVKIVE